MQNSSDLTELKVEQIFRNTIEIMEYKHAELTYLLILLLSDTILK